MILDDYTFDTEIKEQKLVRNLVKEGMIVFDVGANIGKYTKLFSLLVGKSGKVYAFEPSEYSFNKLSLLLKENELINVYPIRKAIYSKNTKVILNEFPDEYCSWNSLGKPQMIDPKTMKNFVPIIRSVEVEAITLDTFCKEHNISKIDYLKLDVEGAEIFAIEGAKELLKNKAIRLIQFEISQKMLEGLNTKAIYVFELLNSYGYECHSINEDGTIGKKVTDSHSFYENYIAFPINTIESETYNSSNLPVHFFTIVLNGEPFIRYHIEVFKQLPFKWHWHIIEGVADLKHDTAWSLNIGGRITNDIHQNGLSKDGTTEYLDELKRQYPNNITIYRKSNGLFWDGKLEMVNAPLININEECLLWQIDSDELWTVEQIRTMYSMFLQHPNKTAAYFYCHYFVGESLVIFTRDTYGNHTSYEWLRTWRFKPGFRWLSHEPPRLCQKASNGEWIDVAKINPFTHKETEAQNLIFQHYAYAIEEQLRFKEIYYGYRNAVEQWKKLQRETKFPVALKNFFAWVIDNAQVDTIYSQNVCPIAWRNVDGIWHFEQLNSSTDDIKNVLWLRVDSIGDNVLASSMLVYIHNKYKNAKITVVCQEHISELYESCPLVDKIITIPTEHSWQNEFERHSIIESIRQIHPDVLFNSTYSIHGISDLQGLEFIPRRIAFRHSPIATYTDLIPTSKGWKLELERYRDFLRFIGFDPPPLKPVVWLTPEDLHFADEFLEKFRLNPDSTIVVFPGSRTFHRKYDILQYAKSLNKITLGEEFNILLLGSNDDKEICIELAKHLKFRTINLAGKTTLRQMAAIIKNSLLYVGTETGAAHIACAVGTKNVVLLGGGHFGRFMPYSPLTSVVCLPLDCYGCEWRCKYQTVHCISDIKPEVITEAIHQTLNINSDKPRIFVQGATLSNLQTTRPRWQWFDEFIDTKSVEIIQVNNVSQLRDEDTRIFNTGVLQSLEYLNSQAEQELLNGNKNKAREILSNILKQYPNDPNALNNLAVLEILEKNWSNALDILTNVIKLDPSNEVAIENKRYLESLLIVYKSVQDAENLISSRQFTEAKQILQTVLEIPKTNSTTLNDIAVFEIIEKAKILLERISGETVGKVDINCHLPSHSTANEKGFVEKIDVSIVIATKNRAQLLDEMLTSLKIATLGITYEVIVVEGNSSDNTLEILNKHGINQIYNEERYIGKGKHSWPVLYNFGLSQARGKWAMYASDDIVFNENCISRAVEILEKQNLDVAGGIFYYKNLYSEPNWDKFGIDYTFGKKLLLNYGLFRLDYFREVNGFDESFQFYCADGDFCLKLYKKGYRLIPLPGCFVVHNNVLDYQKQINLDVSKQDIELYKNKWKHFVSTELPEPRRLLWTGSTQENLIFKMPDRTVSLKDIPTLDTRFNILEQLRKFGIWNYDNSLRLHLGCGEQYLNGYVNIDYPPSMHNILQVKADAYADITKLDFPAGSVDEIRLHHVFEHFNRVTALALLIKWHTWLKLGGKLLIETPDLIGCAKILLGKYSWKTKMGIVRHLAGDQSASWGYHLDHWFAERFERTLSRLGYKVIQTYTTSWQNEPFLSNVTVLALKIKDISLTEHLKICDELLWESIVSPEEEQTFEIWRQQLSSLLSDKHATTPHQGQLPSATPIEELINSFQQSVPELSIQEIHEFNQRDRDKWVRAKALTLPLGSRVLDIGAGTCPYRSFFTHCDYKTQDFKKYTGIKLGGTTEYGEIDYVSDICDIPVPDESFDAILCTEVLEHVPEPIEALREMSRILKHGGRLFLTAPLGSGLHQLPYHYYGGFTPEWYKHFCDKFGLRIVEITPNGGFFKLLAQECARVVWTLPQHQHLHGNNVELIRKLFGEWLPRYLFALEKKHFIDQFTVGYHIEAVKI